jgi:hypothetical protein
MYSHLCVSRERPLGQELEATERLARGHQQAVASRASSSLHRLKSPARNCGPAHRPRQLSAPRRVDGAHSGGRALAQLGIRHIAAYSPAAPRPFRARLSNPPGPPAQGAGLAGDRHHRSGQPLAKAVPACILRLQEERRVGNDNPVKWRGLPPQIPPTPLRAHCAPISCARWRAYTGIPMGSWRSSMVHTAWPNTDPMDTRSRLNPIAARR